MAPWMKRRIEHARARCEKSLAAQKQKAELKKESKSQTKEEAKASDSSRQH